MVPSAPVVTAPPDSSKWRLVAAISDSRHTGYFASNRVALRRIDPSKCSISPVTHEPSCILNGEVVAPWTGPDVSNLGNTPQEAIKSK